MSFLANSDACISPPGGGSLAGRRGPKRPLPMPWGGNNRGGSQEDGVRRKVDSRRAVCGPYFSWLEAAARNREGWAGVSSAGVAGLISWQNITHAMTGHAAWS